MEDIPFRAISSSASRTSPMQLGRDLIWFCDASTATRAGMIDSQSSRSFSEFFDTSSFLIRPPTVPPSSPFVELELSSFLISSGSASSLLPRRSSVNVPTKADLTRLLAWLLVGSGALAPLPPLVDVPSPSPAKYPGPLGGGPLFLRKTLRAAVSVNNGVRMTRMGFPSRGALRSRGRYPITCGTSFRSFLPASSKVRLVRRRIMSASSVRILFPLSRSSTNSDRKVSESRCAFENRPAMEGRALLMRVIRITHG
mmetsp:Transcript_13907/g.25179  ORF Transcript_13907/g.25179 Transcript_13907/m.25179 type:complete len:255 (-) Transcript_13907:13-777(-)